MASPAPREPSALVESVRAVFGGLDADPKLEGKGLSAAFARSFPDPPAEVSTLGATEVARVAVPPVDQLDNLAQFLRERPARCTVIAPH